MIMKLLEIRTMVLKLYQKARFIVNPIVKFILSWIVFNGINDAIGYDVRFTKTIVVLLLSVICAVTPGGVLVFFAMVLSLVHVFSVSIYLSVLLLLVFLILYGMLMRFSPKQAIVAVALPVLAKYNLHYAVPLVLGCVANPLSICACACGVFVYHIIDVIQAAASRNVGNNPDDILQLYIDIADAVMANKQMFIMLVVFSLVIITVFCIRKFSFDYAFLVSITAGMIVNIIGFLVADLKYSVTVNIGILILMTILSGVVAVIVEFIKRVLDYTAVERVQFEDDDYYYYVKAVPKVNVAFPTHSVMHIGENSEASQEIEFEDFGEDVGDFGDEEPADEEIRYEDFDASDFDSSIEESSSSEDDDFEDYEEDMILDDLDDSKK